MSRPSQKLPEPLAGLLRRLTPSAPAGAAIDRVPADFALPPQAVTAIHAAVAFSGTAATSSLPAQLRALTRSRRRDLLGIAWTLCALAPHGHASLLVPGSFLNDTTQGHLQLRRTLVEQGRLAGVMRLAAGCCQARRRAAILLLGPVETGDVWFCDVADAAALHASTDGSEPESVARWRERGCSERDRTRTDVSFLVSRAQIAGAAFDLSGDCRRANPTDEMLPDVRPQELLAELAALEVEIFQGLRDLVAMLKP